MEAFRSQNGLYDLFKSKVGTVSYTTINGKDVFGSNSTSPMYYKSDQLAADALRDRLISKAPRIFKSDNVGEMPNDALYHADTTVLLRAAKEKGGSLAGETLVVHSDKEMCNNCRTALPYAGVEVGNPTVTYVEPNGIRRTMRDGHWIDVERP